VPVIEIDKETLIVETGTRHSAFWHTFRFRPHAITCIGEGPSPILGKKKSQKEEKPAGQAKNPPPTPLPVSSRSGSTTGICHEFSLALVLYLKQYNLIKTLLLSGACRC